MVMDGDLRPFTLVARTSAASMTSWWRRNATSHWQQGRGYGYPVCCRLHFIVDQLLGRPSGTFRWFQLCPDTIDQTAFPVPCGVLHSYRVSLPLGRRVARIFMTQVRFARNGYGPPKTEAGRRDVPVPDRLATILREHAQRTQRHHGPLFVGKNGVTPPAPGAIQERADRAWQAAGVSRTTLHACRHLYASVSAAAGVPLHELSRHMGHSSIAMTIDLYTHLFRGSQAAAAAKVNAYYDTHAPQARGHHIAAQLPLPLDVESSSAT